MYFTYVLKSNQRNYFYVGMTNNPEKRISTHNKGYNKTTKPYLPFEIILIENYPDRISARKREKYLKSGSGKEYIKSLVYNK